LNVVTVSAASVWEIEIKRSTGKLRAPAPLRERVDDEGFAALPITVEHAILAARLAQHHSDPFDRMLVAQAQLEGLTLVTRDPVFDRYDVRVLPA
jgi:PIN domain nuclease of toxin-antitoxin system